MKYRREKGSNMQNKLILVLSAFKKKNQQILFLLLQLSRLRSGNAIAKCLK